MTKLQAIRQFMNEVLGEPITIARRRDDWGMSLTDKTPRLILPHDLQQNDPQDKLFRKDFVARCPLGRGFANVTISLLHEVGHWYTRFEVDWDEYFEECEYVSGTEYFNLYAERIATDWAIHWLQDPANRKMAKAFEVNYFGH